MVRFVWALVAAGMVMALGSTGGTANGLDSVRWEYRPLLVFAPSEDSPALSRQTTMLADAADGLDDRRIAVYIVERDRVYTTYGVPSPAADARALRLRFRVPDDVFRVVLVGLDGGAKLSQDRPLTIERLFETIDAMPMRQRELRARGDL